MATPSIIVPGAGGEVASTLVRAWWAADHTVNFTSDATFTGDTKSSDPAGMFSTSTGVFTIQTAGRYVFVANIVMSNSNLDEGKNNIYASASFGGVGYTIWGPRMANDNFWTNNFYYHHCVVWDCVVNDTVAFVIAQHGASGNHVFRGGSSSYVSAAKVG